MVLVIDAETLRIIIAILSGLAGLVFLVGSMVWALGRLAVGFYKRMDHFDRCMDELRLKMIEKAEEYQMLRDELFYLKGVVGTPIWESTLTTPPKEKPNEPA